MPTRLSPRLAAIVNALPLRPDSRVLEIGCGPGAAARAVAALLTTGHILAIDRSATAITQAQAAAEEEINSGRMSVRQVAAENFILQAHEEPYDIVFAVRVGALDGRHPQPGQRVLQRIAKATRPHARLFIDGGDRFVNCPSHGLKPLAQSAHSRWSGSLDEPAARCFSATEEHLLRHSHRPTGA